MPSSGASSLTTEGTLLERTVKGVVRTSILGGADSLDAENPDIPSSSPFRCLGRQQREADACSVFIGHVAMPSSGASSLTTEGTLLERTVTGVVGTTELVGAGSFDAENSDIPSSVSENGVPSPSTTGLMTRFSVESVASVGTSVTCKPFNSSGGIRRGVSLLASAAA